MNRRILFGMVSLALGCGALSCGSSGGNSSGSGGGNGTGSGGSTSTSSGGQTGTGSGGTTQTTGSGGTTQTGTGGKGSGGTTTTGSGGTGTTGTGGKGSGGTGTTGSGGAGTTGSGGAGATGSGGRGGAGTATGGSPGSGGTGTASGGAAGTSDDSVLERNKNPSRDGAFVQPALTKAAVAMMTADTAFNTAATFTSTVTNGANIAASPLFLDGPNGTGLFFIPTAGGDVVARKEDGTSQWSVSIGTPATGGIGCPFATTPPLGILSTPVIDAQSKTIYVAGIVGNAQGVTGQIASAIDITTGKVKSGWPVSVDKGASFDPTIHNQRSALSLVNGILYVAYAGYVGDCGNYHGRVVAIDTTSPTTMGQWATGDMGGGIWASGGLAADGNNLFVATGNYVPLQTAPATHTDSEEVVRITGMGTKADYFYPSDWASFDKTDADVGSNNPMVITVPGATPSKLVVAIAKGGSGYLLDAAQLRGSTNSSAMGGELASFSLASGSGMSVYGAPASYKTAMGTYIVMSSANASGCPGGGTGRQLMAVRITPSPLSAAVVWCAPMGSATNPIATTTDGTANAVVWFANSGKLVGVDGDTGANLYTSSNSCAGVPKWSSPIAAKGRIVVAGNGRFCAWGLPSALTQAK